MRESGCSFTRCQTESAASAAPTSPVKRTSGYGYGGKDSATGNLAKLPPARAPWLYPKRKWSPPAKSGARSGAHTRRGLGTA
jgi:hypothetical protein